MSNGADSSYNALQAQYRHRLTHGLQALVSYTWSHSIDDASSDAYYLNVPPGVRACCGRAWSVRLRHPQYLLRRCLLLHPRRRSSGWCKPILENWSVNTIVYARSAPPVNVVTGKNPFPGTLPLGSQQRAAAECRARRALLPLRPDGARRKDHQQGGVHRARQRPGRSGTQCPARLRRFAGRFHLAAAVQAQRALFAAVPAPISSTSSTTPTSARRSTT